MSAPNTTILSALVLMSSTTYHTRHPAVFEQIANYVWSQYRSAHDIPWTFPVTDVNGLGAIIYSSFAASNVANSAVGGVAYYLEKIRNIVLTYPWNRYQDDASRSEQLMRGNVTP
jgi:hypothetical protein